MASGGYQYQSEFARTYFAQGEARGVIKGKAESLLTLLDARGLKVTAGQRACVLACTDLELLESWMRRSVAITTTAELFGSPKRVTKPSRLVLGYARTGGCKHGQVLETAR